MTHVGLRVPLRGSIHAASVITGFSHFELFNRYRGLGVGSTIHATYPADGNVHYSLKQQTANEETFVTIYHDRIRRKTVNLITGERTVTEGADFGELELFNLFVPQGPALPLAELALRNEAYNFPGPSYALEAGVMPAAETELMPETLTGRRTNDLYLDTTRLGSGTVIVGAVLHGPDAIPHRFPDMTYSFVLDARGELTLELFTAFSPR